MTLPEDFPFVGKPYVVIHPFPHMATFKTIPFHRWKSLVAWLARTYPGYGIVITGAEVDREQAAEVATEGTYLAINQPLLSVAGLIEHARLYIGVDTGPTHIAGVLNASSVVLAHQNEPTWLPSYNPNALLLWNREHCVCRVPGEECAVEEDGKIYRRCVYYIPDEAIHAAIRGKLDQPA
jgi:ADP-heptose:LPS heptosyltransferase